MFRQQQGGGSRSVHSTPVAVSLRELLAGMGLSRPTVVSAGEQRGSPQSSVHGRKLQERPGLFLRRDFRPVFELDRELGPGSEVMVPTDEAIQWRNLKQDLRRAVYSGWIGGNAPMTHLDGAGA